jgi:lipid-binding SYLF domain-containing protein
MTFKIRSSMVAMLLVGVLAVSAAPASADQEERQETVHKATSTFNDFVRDPDKTWFRQHIGNAQGVLIVPKLVKAGFIIGGSGGSGVLLGRDAKTGEWSYPAFYTMGSVTFGLQIGGQVSNIMMLVMTQKGMDSLLSTDVKLGADASIAVGPVGTGAGAQTADILLFSRDKGLYGGLTVDGSVISPRNSWNSEYYGKSTTATDIIVRRNVSNAGADALRATVTKTAKGG